MYFFPVKLCFIIFFPIRSSFNPVPMSRVGAQVQDCHMLVERALVAAVQWAESLFHCVTDMNFLTSWCRPSASPCLSKSTSFTMICCKFCYDIKISSLRCWRSLATNPKVVGDIGLIPGSVKFDTSRHLYNIALCTLPRWKLERWPPLTRDNGVLKVGIMKVTWFCFL